MLPGYFVDYLNWTTQNVTTGKKDLNLRIQHLSAQCDDVSPHFPVQSGKERTTSKITRACCYYAIIDPSCQQQGNAMMRSLAESDKKGPHMLVRQRDKRDHQSIDRVTTQGNMAHQCRAGNSNL